MISRRQLLTLAAAPAFLRARSNQVTLRIEEIRTGLEDYTYRTPIKFGGTVVDRVTLLNVHARVKGSNGKSVEGFGSMPLGNVWSFPSRVMPYAVTLNAMKMLAREIEQITGKYGEAAHPVDTHHALEPMYFKAAAKVSNELELSEAIPPLCTVTTASPFDAALHDAYGKLLGRSAYQTYGADCMPHDLSHYLDASYKGEYLSRYVLPKPKPRMPLYHLVGAVDPIEPGDIPKRLGDGLPETLEEWILANGLTHMKIKLNGDDLKWDIERVVRVERAAAPVQAKRGVKEWKYSLDFNERCPNVGYLMDCIKGIEERSPAAFARVQYIEQPTARDLRKNPENKMHAVAKIRPVVIDESLTSYADLLLCRELGYSGVALKACKGQSPAMLMGAAAQKNRMFLCVQDLTCPGASLIHSAGVAAHIAPAAAIEANSRQYVPAANQGWEKRFPGLFLVKDGWMKTAEINGLGLGAV
jgi:L-alanine-DL-glutamate epimerase-like enolase superfamily enzyme